MRQWAVRLILVAALAALVAGCDKCADNFLVDPFKSSSSCHGAPPIK